MKKLKISDTIDSIIFDFDGVIADSLKDQEKAWKTAADEVGVNDNIKRTLINNLYDGMSGTRMFIGLELNQAMKEKLRKKKDQYWGNIKKNTPLFENASKVLNELSKCFKLGIATSSSRNYVEMILSRESILNNFTAIITDDEVKRPKPNQEILIELLSNKLKSLPQRALYFGDSQTDYELGKNANIEFILFGHMENYWTKGLTRCYNWSDIESLFFD